MVIPRPSSPKTSKNVTLVCFNKLPSSTDPTNRFHTAPGEGRINSGSSVKLVNPYQSEKIKKKVAGTVTRKIFRHFSREGWE
jgi:hypothetical protein